MEILADFHFLRPQWLWSLLPLAAVLGLLWQRSRPARQKGAALGYKHLSFTVLPSPKRSRSEP